MLAEPATELLDPISETDIAENDRERVAEFGIPADTFAQMVAFAN